MAEKFYDQYKDGPGINVTAEQEPGTSFFKTKPAPVQRPALTKLESFTVLAMAAIVTSPFTLAVWLWLR